MDWVQKESYFLPLGFILWKYLQTKKSRKYGYNFERILKFQMYKLMWLKQTMNIHKDLLKIIKININILFLSVRCMCQELNGLWSFMNKLKVMKNIMSCINYISIKYYTFVVLFSTRQNSHFVPWGRQYLQDFPESDLIDMNLHGLHTFHAVILVVGQLWHLYILLELDHWFNLG